MSVSREHKESGFTLIEVLVASTIVITTMGVLLQLFGSGLDRIHRSGAVGHRVLMEKQIVSELKTVNPALHNSGEGLVEGWVYRWRAEQTNQFRTMNVSGQSVNKKAALFNVTVDLMQDKKLKYSFELVLLGWLEVQ